MIKIPNPYEGIQFYPAVAKFAASITEDGSTTVLGYFESLGEAVAARKGVITYTRIKPHA